MDTIHHTQTPLDRALRGATSVQTLGPSASTHPVVVGVTLNLGLCDRLEGNGHAPRSGRLKPEQWKDIKAVRTDKCAVVPCA